MKKIKVHNMIFMDASYSFSFLRMYYEHVLALFNQSSKRAQEFRGRMKAEYESKGREYESQHMKEFHKIFDEAYPGYFHNSFLVSACSLFEHEAKKVWAFIQEEHKVPFGWHVFKELPVPQRMKKLLNFAGVTPKDDPPRIELPPPDFKPTTVYDKDRTVISTLWRELGYYFRVRNCIVHDNGLIEKAKGSSTLKEYATEKGIIVERDDQPEIQLNEAFNVTVCNTMGKFFNKLTGAYYSAPLPEE